MIFSFMLSAPRYVLSILLLKVDWAGSPFSLNLKLSRVIYAFPVLTCVCEIICFTATGEACSRLASLPVEL